MGVQAGRICDRCGVVGRRWRSIFIGDRCRHYCLDCYRQVVNERIGALAAQLPKGMEPGRFENRDRLFRKLLDKNPNPSEEEIRFGLAGNLCRCTGYDKIVRAVQATAKEMRGA